MFVRISILLGVLGGALASRVQQRSGAPSASKDSRGPGPAALFAGDENLAAEGVRDHLLYRWSQYNVTKTFIEDHEGGLLDFASAYHRFGSTVAPDGTFVHREWVPWAHHVELIGDFNGWAAGATPMLRGDYGMWSVELPAGTVEHGSRLKVRMMKPDGHWVDRLPAWTRRAAPPPGVMGASYDAIFWDPPKKDRHVWKHDRPQVLHEAPMIYEAHVGMASEEPRVGTYREFADDVLPHIVALGYNTVQLMAIMEHSYYGSFGYHVTCPFAVTSRSGTPEDLKFLVDTAHGLGLRVIMDIVHSHVSKNIEDGLAGYDVGQNQDDSYFWSGDRGYHKLWDSRLYRYQNVEVLRYLLSNLKYYMEEFRFDGFRFDGVTSMLYHHHGINFAFTGGYHEYFGLQTDVDACVYLMLANELIHTINPFALSIAEDVSGMPALGRPVVEGGLGFDYRLAMGMPDLWIDLLKNFHDETWSMNRIVATLCNRRRSEGTIAYVESHDQSIVGDKTTLMWLLDEEIYSGMSALGEPSVRIERGIALHKMLRLVTFALGGEGYMTFMGNEFGHPEWIDFPRDGNDWSHHYARRQWSLADMEHLRYVHLLKFDQAMLHLEKQFGPLLNASHLLVSDQDEERKVIVAERGPLLFVLNFHPSESIEELKVGIGEPGKYRLVLDTDAWDFGARGRAPHGIDYFTQPEGEPGKPETNFHDRPASFIVSSPCRSAQVYANADVFILDSWQHSNGEEEALAAEEANELASPDMPAGETSEGAAAEAATGAKTKKRMGPRDALRMAKAYLGRSLGGGE